MSDYGLLVSLSQAPVVFLFFYVYFQDKQGYEPFSILLRSFVAGAVSMGAALIIELCLLKFELPYGSSAELQIALVAVFFVALVEEGCKFAALYYTAYRRAEFNEPYDGIMYSVSASLGFAALENLFYCLQNGVGTAVFRIFTAVPMHAMAGVLMGYYVGLAKFNRPKERNLQLAGITAATIAHGLYDYFLLLQRAELIPLAFAILGVQVVLGWKAIRRHRNIVLANHPPVTSVLTEASPALVDPVIEAEPGLLGTPLRWATIALKVLAVGTGSAGVILQQFDRVVTYRYLGIPIDSDAVALFLLPAAFAIWTLSAALKQLRPPAWRLASILCFLLLPTPLFLLALPGIYGLLHPDTRRLFGHHPPVVPIKV